MDRVYVIGGTGGIGNEVVKGLLAKGVGTTVLARNPEKAETLFGKSDHLKLVEGDYTNIDKFKSTISGHTRLFLLVSGHDMVRVKSTFAKLAYEAGVKQIVHVSSLSVSGSWRKNFISTNHSLSEEAIFNIPNRAAYVTLRPSGFFTNHFLADSKTILSKGIISAAIDPDQKRPWISPNDIAQVAVNVLTEPIEKHGDAVYEMTSELLSGNDRARIFSRVLGKDIKYVEVSVEEEYNKYLTIGMPHEMAYCLIDFSMGDTVNVALPVILGRKTETLESWVTNNKSRFIQ